MRISVAVICALAVAIALAQGGGPQGRSPRGAADAGTPRPRTPTPILLGTDPPGKLRPWPSDAGPVAQVDAGPSEAQRELQQLRSRVEALERESAQLQQQTQQFQEVARQLQALRAQIADGEDRRQAAEQQQAAGREQLQAGVNALYQAQSMLAGGNASVDDQLSQAQAAFPPQAQREIHAARTALQNRDLSAARSYLSAAIAAAQLGR